MQRVIQPSVEAKVAFLRGPGAYPDRPERVEIVETHFAWVFLSRELVYKLKKPIAYRSLDLTSVESRRISCELEVALNRRLAATTYLDHVPLTRTDGSFELEGTGPPVDWLVKMRRLDRDRTLERSASAGTLEAAELEAVVAKLARFYSRAAHAPWDGAQYRAHLEDDIEQRRRELADAAFGLHIGRIEEIAACQRAFVARHATALERRIDAGRVVDAHGDLRPEHIFVGDDPQIIDCLEFSHELRRLDTAEEIAFLCLECDRLDLAGVAGAIRDLYARLSSDAAAGTLEPFYRSRRALSRALVYAWRLSEEQDSTEAAGWRRRARWYIDAAWRAISRLAAQTAR